MTSPPDDTTSDTSAIIAALRAERDAALAREAALNEALATRNSEYGERIEQQSATIDVLKVMSVSPGDPQPVFDLIATRARDLCDAYGVTVFEFDGTLIHWRAATGVSDDPTVRGAAQAMFPMAPTREWGVGRAILERRVIRIDDLETEPGLSPALRAGTAKSSITIPLMRGDVTIGALALASRERGGFTKSQIELFKTFAEQAVIAISSAETYRALQDRTAALSARNSEYGERIEQQAATIDVLKVMSSSPGDAQPVFELIVERARAFCGADECTVALLDGDMLHLTALAGMSETSARNYSAQFPRPVNTASMFGRAILAREAVQTPDVSADPEHFSRTRVGGPEFRAIVAVPMLRAGTPIGAIGLGRKMPGVYSATQMELLRTFAEQAVIAITSAETYRALQTRTADLQETLEYQTATSDVLKVISRSTFDLQPVLETLVETAARLCDADQAVIAHPEGDLWRLRANFGFPPEYEAYQRERGLYSLDPHAPNVSARAVRERRPVHIHDVAEVPGYPEIFIRLAKQRSSLGVPLLREGEAIGYIVLARQRVEPFTDRQIELVSTFADQAVIAIENTRLITEQREALEQQTATAEVLQIINSSPGDLAPVFEAMLDKAIRLCEAAHGHLLTYDGECFHLVAASREPHYVEWARQVGAVRPGPSAPLGRISRGERIVHIADLREEEVYRTSPAFREQADIRGARSQITVGLLKDNTLLGAMIVYRQEVRPFSDKQIALLENFAAQAVIAMENARLITEQREALEQQTATAEVLQVINSSPGDLAPVFDALLEKAVELCDAAHGVLRAFDGEFFHLAAVRGEADAVEGLKQLGAIDLASIRADDMLGAIVRGEAVVHITDVRETDTYRDNPIARERSETLNQRTWLAVALRKDGVLLGVIMIYRTVVRPFTSKQAALLQNFAAQAVIAMENARLLTETREALEQQTATAEVLGVINSSPGELPPVFDAMLERAMRLCEASYGEFRTYDGQTFHIGAMRGVPANYAQFMAQSQADFGPKTGPGRVLRGEPLVHILDLADTDNYRAGEPNRRALVDLGGARTLLLVPLRKDEEMLGYIMIYRTEVRPFTDKQIALLQNFAAQAVIAMENARLLTEQQEALEQQTATAEVLQVINANPGNLSPVFDAILEKAHSLIGAVIGALVLYEGPQFRAVATHGFSEKHNTLVRQLHGPTAGHLELLDGRRFKHYHDLWSIENGQHDAITRSHVENNNARTALWVPLRKDDRLLGLISVYRLEVRPFLEKEIALLENFAAQAVIAMENARLLDEIRQRQEELRVTFENMGDGVAMFDETQRLVAWNRKFQDILDVPDDIIARRQTFTEYVRYLAERGEYDPEADPEEHVRRLIEQAGQSRTYERTRPDGRVIEIRHNPVPSGGFVLIYADITERKRSEAEIRAARDAAEEASRTIEAAYRELKTAQANLIQAEKMASLGQLTAGIAHEIKNPLNFVNNFAALSTELIDELREVLAPEPLGETVRAEVEDLTGLLKGNLQKVVQHGQRADGIVKSMLEHSRGSSGERRMVDLNAVIDEALNLAYHGARAQDQSFNVTLERDFDEGISPIEVNPQDITRVFLNLFANGFYAVTRRGRDSGDAGFVPTLKVTTCDAGEAVEIRVRDNGTGIPADIRDKLFQPFFTTKPTGEGTGLGLSITYDIVTQQHGGTIAIESEVGEYSEFTVRLPLYRP